MCRKRDSDSRSDNRGLPLGGQAIVLTVGAQETEVETDMLGRVQTMLKIDQGTGLKNLTVAFAGDSRFQPKTATTLFAVLQEDINLAYQGARIVERNQSAQLRAQITELDQSIGDLSGKTVVFTVYGASGSQQVEAVTNAGGVAETMAQINLAADLYDVRAEFSGDAYYNASDTWQTPFVTWEAIPGLNVNGGGWVNDQGKKANFGFTAKYVAGSTEPFGQFEFHNGDRNQNIKSAGFDWLVITSDDVALLEGMATINGLGGHTLRLVAADKGTPGAGADTYALYVDGLLIVEGVLGGGNIKVH